MNILCRDRLRMLLEEGRLDELVIGNTDIINLLHHWKHWILDLNLGEKLLHADG